MAAAQRLPTALLLRVAIVLLASSQAAAQRGSDCTAKATWPDGRDEDRECIVDGEGKRSPGASTSGGTIGNSFAWLKDTRWNWNNWRDVVFRADGSFLAPAENCEREGNPACRWYTNEDDDVVVKFGGAGVHVLTPDAEKRLLTGFRDSDGDAVTATRK